MKNNPKREAILQFIRAFCQEHGYSPSMREIVAGAHLSSTSVAAYHMYVLLQEDRIIWPIKIARSVRVIDEKETT